MERVTRPSIPVFGMSLESLRASSLLAQTEMESFLEKAQNSTVSHAYYHHLQHKSTGSTIKTPPPATEEPDPFHGMQDAAAIVLEIVRKVQNLGQN